ncbi:hypothetical protein Ciccas_001441 [Cichlidogyrus casuarinus]|uniref:Uncharacterized protein n=1 Tax=Cichlidogyrus casuarinus TaxID=1844966 RepID=A0ABD2QK20_9PLAT
MANATSAFQNFIGAKPLQNGPYQGTFSWCRETLTFDYNPGNGAAANRNGMYLGSGAPELGVYQNGVSAAASFLGMKHPSLYTNKEPRCPSLPDKNQSSGSDNATNLFQSNSDADMSCSNEDEQRSQNTCNLFSQISKRSVSPSNNATAFGTPQTFSGINSSNHSTPFNAQHYFRQAWDKTINSSVSPYNRFLESERYYEAVNNSNSLYNSSAQSSSNYFRQNQSHPFPQSYNASGLDFPYERGFSSPSGFTANGPPGSPRMEEMMRAAAAVMSQAINRSASSINDIPDDQFGGLFGNAQTSPREQEKQTSAAAKSKKIPVASE